MNKGAHEIFTKHPHKNLKMEANEGDMTKKPENHCSAHNLRLCPDGSCVSSLDLCTEEEKVNQNTILIMIIIGLAFIVAMVILYCFQQRSRRLVQSNNQGALETIVGDGDNASLNNPPPAYDEVMGSDLYLPTVAHQQRMNGISSLGRLPSSEEPMTPPPNYDAALTILGQSQDSFFPKKTEQTNSVIRRSISTETTSPSSPLRSASAAPQQFEFRHNFSHNESNQ